MLLALSGCSWVGLSEKPQACPTAVVLHPLANTAVFAPGTKPVPENVAFYGILDEVNSQCDYESGAVKMTLDVIVIGQRGPSAQGDTATFHYFVAVTGPNNQILGKEPLTVDVPMPPDKIRAGVTDHIEETVPLAGHKGSALNFLVGFQQSPEALDFYKHFRGRPTAYSR